MSDSVQMPALGESVTEGTVTRWLKQVGERVEVDEPLLEVSTDKVDTEIPSPVAGVVEQILVAEDETVAVGTQLAVIGSGESGSAPAAAPAAEPEPAPAPVAAAEPEPAPGARAGCRTRARAPAPEPAAAASTGGQPGPDARAGRERHRGHGHPLAEVRGRHGRGRRAAARGLHRQGRHRDPLAGGRCAHLDPRRRRTRHGAGRCRPGCDRWFCLCAGSGTGCARPGGRTPLPAPAPVAAPAAPAPAPRPRPLRHRRPPRHRRPRRPLHPLPHRPRSAPTWVATCRRT